MLGLIQHLRVSDQCSNWRPSNSWTSSTQELHHKRNLQTVGQLRGQWIFYFNYKHYGRPDLKCGSHPQVKPIGIGWAGVSPLGLNAQPFLRSQGPRMGYTSELYQCGFEPIGFVCRKSTMMESLCSGDSSSCRWVVLASPGFPL